MAKNAETSPGSASTPAAATRTLSDLVDVLLPGDEVFPAASALGTQRLVADRLRERYGEQYLQWLMAAIDALGGPLARLDRPARENLVRQLEHEHAMEFARLRDIAYLSYYESAEVVAAIRSLGHRYNVSPQPEGYPLAAFDPATDAPRHGR